MISYSFLNNNKYQKIVDICSKVTSTSSTYALTFSQHSTWPIDYIPPSVTPDITTPVELFAYLKPSSASPVVQTITQSYSDFNFNGIFYKKIFPSFSEVSSSNSSEVCFEATLNHNSLPQASWRSLGLALSSTAITNSNLITSGFSNLTHIYLQYSGPKTKELNVTETVRLILPVSTLL